MKKLFLTLFSLIIMILFPLHVNAVDNNNYKAAVLIDYKSGRVLYEQNKDKVLPEASITKLMTYYVIKDYLKSKNISEKTIIKIETNSLINQYDASGIGLKKGQNISISDLISSMMIASANDSAMALENYYKASGGNFIEAMNKKAIELGLGNTIFVNTTGLTIYGKQPELNTTSAYDIALLSKYVINDYPEILKITSMNSFTINSRTYLNTNGTLRADQRIDGLKTGHTKEAGYCLAATENIIGNRYKNKSFPNSIVTADMRLIAVVFGCDSEEQRIAESLKLLDYGEKNFTYELLLSQNDKYKFKNDLYSNGFIDVSPGKELFLLKNKNEKYEISYTINGSLPDKIKKGDLIGTAKLKSKTGMLEYTADLYASDNYNKVNIFKRMYIFINRVFVNFMNRLKLYF